MRLPQPSAAWTRRVTFACYVEVALLSEDLEVAAAAVRVGIDALKVAGRAHEDAVEKTFGARARRDLAVWQLNRAIQQLRLDLSSRGLDATSKAPYTAIFPDGIDFYIEAPIPQQVQRTTLLAERVSRHLDAQDPLRAPLLAAVEQGLARWTAAQAALEDVRRQRSHAAQALEAAEVALNEILTDTWADRVKAENRKVADRYFPKVAKAGPNAEPGGVDPVA